MQIGTSKMISNHKEKQPMEIQDEYYIVKSMNGAKLNSPTSRTSWKNVNKVK